MVLMVSRPCSILFYSQLALAFGLVRFSPAGPIITKSSSAAGRLVRTLFNDFSTRKATARGRIN